MKRRLRPRSGPDSVWRILRRLARENRRHEEWRRRFELEERAREAQLRSEEAAWRQQLESGEAAGRQQLESGEAAWRQELESREAARRQERQELDAREAAGQEALRRAIHRLMGDGDARFGRLMEALTEGDLVPLLQSAGYEVYGDLVKRRGISRQGIPVAEMDLIALGDSVSVGVEGKTTLRPEYIRHFVGKIDRFRELFPDVWREAVHGAMAYLTATESAPTMALRRGLLLIRVVGSSASSRWWNPGERRGRRGARLTRRVREEYRVYSDRNATMSGAKRRGSGGMDRRSNAAWVSPPAAHIVNPPDFEPRNF